MEEKMVDANDMALWHTLNSVKLAAPTFLGTYKERQKQWVEHHRIKVGSKVKVVRKTKDFEDGWGMCWAKEMDEEVGKTFTIKNSHHTEGFDFTSGGGCCFPYFILEPVK